LTDPFELEARYYDKIWGSSNYYETESQVLHQILERYRVQRVLDLACGTGGHCLELAKLGYNVVGLDISQTMLEKVRQKFSNLGMQPTLVLGDMKKTYSILKDSKIALPFDAVFCMGNSLEHMLDDESLMETLNEVWKVLRKAGVFVFRVNNAKQIREDRLRRLGINKTVNESDLQLALLDCNLRDNENEDILIWNAIWLINDHGKIDFQVRTHSLRFFRYNHLKKILQTHGFRIISAYGDATKREPFDEDRHVSIFMICQKG